MTILNGRPDLLLAFDGTTGSTSASKGNFGGSVALVVAQQVWDITPDDSSGIDVNDQSEYLIHVQAASAVGAAARMFVWELNGSAIRVSAIDPATGLAANVGATLLVSMTRVPPVS